MTLAFYALFMAILGAISWVTSTPLHVIIIYVCFYVGVRNFLEGDIRE